MKLTPQALQRFIKEELEVILTDDEAAELFGEQIRHIIDEITKKVVPPSWARRGFQGDIRPFGSPYPRPGDFVAPLPTVTQKHDWAIRQRRHAENAKRAANLEKRGILSRASRGDVKLFRQLRGDAFETAWEAEKKSSCRAP